MMKYKILIPGFTDKRSRLGNFSKNKIEMLNSLIKTIKKIGESIFYLIKCYRNSSLDKQRNIK